MSLRVDARQPIEGLTKLSQALPKVSMTARKVSADSGVTGAKAKVHKVKGNLQRSIRIFRETQDTTSFGSDLSYALKEETRVGGKRHPGSHAYMAPEYNRLQTFFPEQFIMELRRVF